MRDKKLKVLVVEDDSSVRTFLNRVMVKYFSAEVIEAENGKIGLEKLESEEIDFVFLDIAMPVMNGHEFLKEIRKISKFKDLPVIIISANSERELVGDLITLGITDYLVKPIEYRTVKARIENIIEPLGLNPA